MQVSFSLSAVSHSSKLVKPEKVVVVNSDLLISSTEVAGNNLGTYYLKLASEVGWEESYGTESLNCEI